MAGRTSWMWQVATTTLLGIPATAPRLPPRMAGQRDGAPPLVPAAYGWASRTCPRRGAVSRRATGTRTTRAAVRHLPLACTREEVGTLLLLCGPAARPAELNGVCANRAVRPTALPGSRPRPAATRQEHGRGRRAGAWHARRLCRRASTSESTRLCGTARPRPSPSRC